MSAPVTPEPQYQQDGAGTVRVILGVTFLLSCLLGVLFGVQYTSVMEYVKTTLSEPETPPIWETEALSPEQCVDAAMTWTAGCRGIKSMCDMYVDQVIKLCFDTQDRSEYCHAVLVASATTNFGHEECRVRGVRRNIDAEACANSYRAIGSYCQAVVEAELAGE